MPRARGRALVALAAALADGDVVLDRGADRDDVRRRAAGVPGIGPWTADYIALRALGHPDVFLPTDVGVRHALAGSAATRASRRTRRTWRPWRSYALMHLWRACSRLFDGTTHKEGDTHMWTMIDSRSAAAPRRPRRHDHRDRVLPVPRRATPTAGRARRRPTCPRRGAPQLRRTSRASSRSSTCRWRPTARLPARGLGRAARDRVRQDRVVRRDRPRLGLTTPRRERSGWPTAATRSRSWSRATG